MLIAGFPAGSFAANCYLIAPAAGEECLIIDPGQDSERGIEELSLNFAAHTKCIREPGNPFEYVLGRAASVLDRYLQVESLYRFNVKFQPRWEPRYLVYEGRLGLVRAAVAAMWAEGQMPKPKLPRRQARSSQRTLKTVNR